MADGLQGPLSDQEILDFLREVAIEGYATDRDLVREVALGLALDHRGEEGLPLRVARLAPPLLDELHRAEAAWPIPTDNDRLDRAFAGLEQDGIHTLQNWYGCQEVADEEMRHELQFARLAGRLCRGFAFFHGGDTRRAIAGGGLRITWGPALPRNAGKARREHAAWEIAQEIHRALWGQGLSPEWSQVVGEPITLPFEWRRRRKRHPPPPRPGSPPSPAFLRAEAELRAFEPPAGLVRWVERMRVRQRLRVVRPPEEP